MLTRNSQLLVAPIFFVVYAHLLFYYIYSLSYQPYLQRSSPAGYRVTLYLPKNKTYLQTSTIFNLTPIALRSGKRGKIGLTHGQRDDLNRPLVLCLDSVSNAALRDELLSFIPYESDWAVDGRKKGSSILRYFSQPSSSNICKRHNLVFCKRSYFNFSSIK